MLLALETSCDETSAAVIHDGAILANVVSSQIRLHAEYGGVVPELATREHLRNLLPVARAALHAAGVTPRMPGTLLMFVLGTMLLGRVAIALSPGALDAPATG